MRGRWLQLPRKTGCSWGSLDLNCDGCTDGCLVCFKTSYWPACWPRVWLSPNSPFWFLSEAASGKKAVVHSCGLGWPNEFWKGISLAFRDWDRRYSWVNCPVAGFSSHSWDIYLKWSISISSPPGGSADTEWPKTPTLNHIVRLSRGASLTLDNMIQGPQANKDAIRYDIPRALRLPWEVKSKGSLSLWSRLNSLLHTYTIIYLSVLLLIDTWALSIFDYYDQHCHEHSCTGILE